MPIADAVTWDRGVHVRSTPLWVDAERPSELALITTLHRRVPGRHRRVATTTGVAAALVRAGYSGTVLPMQPGRWVSLGGQRVSFVDLHGDSPAESLSTAALVEHGDARILAADSLVSASEPWPKFDHAVLSLPAFKHKGAGVTSVAAALAEFFNDATTSGKRATAVIHDPGAAVALLRVLRQMGLIVRPVGRLGRLAASTVVGHEGDGRLTMRLAGDRGGRIAPAVSIATIDLGLPAEPVPGEQVRLAMGWYLTADELRRMAQESGLTGISVIQGSAEVLDLVRAVLGPTIAIRALTPVHQLKLA